MTSALRAKQHPPHHHHLRAMRHVFGYVSASPGRSLLNDFYRRSLPSRGRDQWTITSWTCQQCYHHNQRTVASKRGIDRQPLPIPRPHISRQAEVQRASFSSSRSRLHSTDASSEASKLRNDLPSQEEGRRSHLSKRLSLVMDHVQSNIFIAGQRLNDLTGYSGIEALKKDIEQQGQSVRTSMTRPALTLSRGICPNHPILPPKGP